MIEVSELRVRRGGRMICAVGGLAIAIGERVCIRGENGSGKTTLLRVMAGLEQGFEGRCDVAGSSTERVFVHQSPYLFRGSVLANVTYGLRARGQHGAALRARLAPWIERLDLAPLLARRTSTLSGGEQRRVALARALVVEPPLVHLDEPFADLDADRAAQVDRAIRAQPETTVVIASPLDVDPNWGYRTIAIETPARA